MLSGCVKCYLVTFAECLGIVKSERSRVRMQVSAYLAVSFRIYDNCVKKAVLPWHVPEAIYRREDFPCPSKSTSTSLLEMSGFHYLPCSLFLWNVEQSHPQSYYVLPLDSGYATLFSHGDWSWDSKTECISNGDFKSTAYETYSSLTYEKSSIFFHRRCFDFVKRLSYAQLYLLCDVVEAECECERKRQITDWSYFKPRRSLLWRDISVS